MAQDNKFTRSLIESAKEGNNAAKEQLYEMSLENVYKLSFLLTCDKPSAELITINTFVSAWNFIGTIEEDVTLTDWIRNIVVYVAVKNLKNNLIQKNRKN